MNNKVKYFEHNTVGRDFFSTDIHGCFDEFMKLLYHVEFDAQKDRLFSGADLVDRGLDSVKCLDLIYEDWFHPVLANHEDMMFGALLDNNDNMLDNWMYNGGQWFASLMKYEQQHVIDTCKVAREKMPLVIVIGKDTDKRINIVHAELYKNKDENLATDFDIDTWNFDEYQEDSMIWGRSIAENKPMFINNSKYNNDGLSVTYCGHTPQQTPIQLMNHRFCDTGAVFYHTKQLDRILTMTNLEDETIYSLDMRSKNITEYKWR